MDESKIGGVVDHSPRPWARKASKDGKKVSLTSSDGTRIAVIDTKDVSGLANAKLIAAAPFLLESAVLGFKLIQAGLAQGVLPEHNIEIQMARKYINDSIEMAVFLDEEQNG